MEIYRLILILSENRPLDIEEHPHHAEEFLFLNDGRGDSYYPFVGRFGKNRR